MPGELLDQHVDLDGERAAVSGAGTPEVVVTYVLSIDVLN